LIEREIYYVAIATIATVTASASTDVATSRKMGHNEHLPSHLLDGVGFSWLWLAIGLIAVIIGYAVHTLDAQSTPTTQQTTTMSSQSTPTTIHALK